MATTLRLEKRLRLAGILVILGLLVEGVCLLRAGPLAFIFLVGVGGLLCVAGIARVPLLSGFLRRSHPGTLTRPRIRPFFSSILWQDGFAARRGRRPRPP